MRILVSGSLAYDRIMDFPDKFANHILPDKIHILNVCFMVNGLKEQFGGTAGNIAYNLSLLGEKPIILASAGKDFASYAAWLGKNGLSLEGVRVVDDEFTAGAYITTDLADNQITGFNPGAMKYPCQYDVQKYRDEQSLAIIAPGNLDDMVSLSRSYKSLKIPYIFDPGQSIPALTTDNLLEMITGSMLFISNDYELEMVLRSTGLSKDDLLDKTDAVITTLAERGSIVRDKNGETSVRAVTPLKVSDPTGAGDSFRAGLIKGLVMGKTIREAALMGAVCASFGVECQGTQCHWFSTEDFWTRHDGSLN